MKQSDNIANLAKALLIAQKNINAGIVKNQKNTTYGNGYADLGAVIDASKQPLLDAGLVILQSPTASANQGEISVTTRLIHETGEWLEDTMTFPLVFLDPQAVGTGISYARRYAQSAILNLHQKDDDGNSASGIPSNADTSSAGTTQAETGSGTSQKEDAPAPAPAPLDPALQKRVTSWLNTIANASLERLEISRESAKSTFNGDTLKMIDKAFGDRIDALRAAAPSQQAA